ncbi:origin recognition complex protein subunit 2, putative [Perkinsus marinus ATCC 50983]|uniref:Origin recognition complex subunit 2 n=1 Tax=Perkinsus marinus (strain ATCC 50983 / TXsc) TaxID=423536 RepID=C5KQ42_PERM5|nr:origin recognition complex protein subunit 2, putative [Perkinsus marinus ATCC 50983]EER13397.1 origin recognition complex protein subunit 2, putative [Perkinsus marinus ATCC 50983]|eukprot:XP_002781602.1 origin recognition complex protein subunit 2, putative [Perkinsus marinus ATCC 50983]
MTDMSSSAVEAMRDRYPTWRSLLHSRFNLLFYGYGSKTPLLSDFADEGLDDGYVVRIEGYMASPRGMNGASILHRCLLGIFDFVFRHALVANDATLLEIARKLAQLSQYHARTSSTPTRIYLVIDNMERLVEYGGDEVLQCLGTIVAGSPTIHLIASVDHHRSALMGNILETFAFVNIPVHTRLDYNREVMAFNDRVLPTWTGLGGGLGEGSTVYGGSGLAVVLKSLTPNHLNLLKHLALLLMESSEPDGTVHFDTLLKVTKRKAIASNHVKLKSLLTELIDHRVVIQRRSPTTGAQMYHMPYGKKQIEVIGQGDFDAVDKV